MRVGHRSKRHCAIAWTCITTIAMGSAQASAIVLDLRPEGAAARRESVLTLWEQLKTQGVELALPAQLHASADIPYYPELVDSQQRAQDALSSARQGSCQPSQQLATQALEALARLQTLGAPVVGDLRRAYAAQLVCADQDKQIEQAANSAAMLRKFDESPAHPGTETTAELVGSRLWARYPAVDATSNVLNVELTVAEPRGELVFVDHVAVASAPVSVIVKQGLHWFGAGGALQKVEVDGSQKTLTLEPPRDVARAIRKLVIAMRADEVRRDSVSLSRLMRATDSNAVVVWRQNGSLLVWSFGFGFGQAHLIGGARDAEHVAQMLTQPQSASLSFGAASSPALTTYTDEEPTDPTEWWLYAGIAGAVILSVSVFVVACLGQQDRQRIEVVVP